MSSATAALAGLAIGCAIFAIAAGLVARHDLRRGNYQRAFAGALVALVDVGVALFLLGVAVALT